MSASATSENSSDSESKLAVVYIIQCQDKDLDNKIYIGSSLDFENRIRVHKTRAKEHKKYGGNAIYFNMFTNGIDKYIFTILERLEDNYFGNRSNQLRKLEDKYVKQYKSEGYQLYNMNSPIYQNHDISNEFYCPYCNITLQEKRAYKRHICTTKHAFNIENYIEHELDYLYAIYKSYDELQLNALYCDELYRKSKRAARLAQFTIYEEENKKEDTTLLKYNRDWRKKNSTKYECECCKYHTWSKTSYSKHIVSKRHLRNIAKQI